MSLVPLIFSNWWEELDYPHRLLDQHFGHGLFPEDLDMRRPLTDVFVMRPHHYYRKHHRTPYDRSLNTYQRSGVSTVHRDKDKFLLTLDVQHFRPEEVTVKVVGKNVVVEGKHEEIEDEHGYISRQFTRRYHIPEQCDINKIASNLSSDGVLTITAPRKEVQDDKSERKIEIQLTGQPALTNTSESSKQREQSSQSKSSEQQQRSSGKTVKAA